MNNSIFHQDKTLYKTNEYLSEKIENLFEENGHLFFLIDTTLDNEVLKNVINKIREDQIYYIFFGKGQNSDNSLVLINITSKKIMDFIKGDLIYNLFRNINFENNSYFVHGFGVSDYSITELGGSIKRKLLINDLGQYIIFRWYDPRVIIYLENIFNDEQFFYLFQDFDFWNFLHPSGYFNFELKYKINITPQSICRLTKDQSVKLDLIQISNIVYRELNHFKEIDIREIDPISIHKSLFTAIDKYKLDNTEDLIAYGLYSQIIHWNFLNHDLIIEILHQYCDVDGQNFVLAMDKLDASLYPKIKKDLELMGESWKKIN